MLQDIRYAVKMIAQRRALSFLIIAMLAIGIGANTAIFSAVDALVLRPFSFPNQDRLVVIHERKLEIGIPRASVAPGNLSDWRTRAKSFEHLIALRTEEFDLRTGDLPERFTGYKVSTGFFDALGVQAALGRHFVPEDGAAGGNPVVVLKNTLWQRRFSSDPEIIGKTISLNGQAHTIVGVMPADFAFPIDGGELWTPLIIEPARMDDRGSHYLRVVGLLRPGVEVTQASEEIHSLMVDAEKRYPATNAGMDAYVVGLNADYTRGSRSYLLIVVLAVGMVLLIACANAANLLLVRASARQRELAVRMALGASRWRVIRQILVESLVLSLFAGGVGLGLSYWGVSALAQGMPEGFSQFIPGWSRLSVSRTALGFTAVISVSTGLLFGMLPALQSSRLNLNEILKSGARNVAGASSRRWRSSLVIAEIALSFILLIAAGLLVRSVISLLQTDFGFDPRNAVSLKVVLPKDRYATVEQRADFYRDLLARLARISGNSAVGATDTLPMATRRNSSFFQIAGQTPIPAAKQPTTEIRITTPGFFAATGTTLRSGRLFTEEDTSRAPAVAVVNEGFASRYFPGRAAIGERILFGSSAVEIVGIVSNVMNDDFDEPAEPAVYQPHAQLPSAAMSVVIRSNADVGTVVGAARSEIGAIDPIIAISDVKTLEQTVDERSAPKRMVTTLLAVFAGLALTLAVVGLYGITAFSVAQRTQEFGIRIALGAPTKSVLGLVLWHSIRLTGVGLILGVLGALAAGRLLKQMLYGLSAHDPLTFTTVIACFAIVSVIASLAPAIRAARVDPISALRHEA